MDKIHYPLEQLSLIKNKRLEEAEKVFQEKKAALLKEEEKLETVEKDRDKVKYHKELKLEQLRNELDTGTTSLKVQQMKVYLKDVDEKLKQKEVKVKEQKKQVDLAASAVETARKDMLEKQMDVEKMRIHRSEWEKEKQKHLEHLESIETDELGTTIHLKQKKNKRSDS